MPVVLDILAIAFFFYGYGDPRDLHSFPTRRSSDLLRSTEQVLAHDRRVCHPFGSDPFLGVVPTHPALVAGGDVFDVDEDLVAALAVPVHVARVLRVRSEEHTSELQSLTNLVCRLLP